MTVTIDRIERLEEQADEIGRKIAQLAALIDQLPPEQLKAAKRAAS